MKFLFLRYSSLCILTGVLALLGACGQKGKLVMPPKPEAISTPYPIAPPDEPNDIKPAANHN